MNLSKISYELYNNGMFEPIDKDINLILFPYANTGKYISSDLIVNRDAVENLPKNFGSFKSIVNYCFADTKKLTSVNLPVCEYVGDCAFGYCTSLTDVNLPVCKSIGKEAFVNCCSLTDVNLPACVSIGAYAFAFCSSLTNIDLPACEYIGEYAFEQCSSLTSINLPACSYLAYSAFTNCSSLTSVNLPACEYIDAYAFNYCKKLESLYLTNLSVASLYSTDAFKSTPMSNSSYLGHFGSIYVPSSLLSEYQSATNWSFYSNRFVGI